MKTDANIHDVEEDKIDQAAALRCKELASMKALTFRHWEEITGVGICSGNSHVVSQKGIHPEQYSDDDLKLLAPEERKTLLEMADHYPLIFPCSPSQLLSFVDDDPAMCFEVPDAFREAVKLLVMDAASKKSIDPNSAFDQRLKKRKAMIDELRSIWPEIENHLSEASRNGLSVVAKAGGSLWRLDEATKWAAQRGAIGKPKATAFVRSNDESELSAILRVTFQL